MVGPFRIQIIKANKACPRDIAIAQGASYVTESGRAIWPTLRIFYGEDSKENAIEWVEAVKNADNQEPEYIFL